MPKLKPASKACDHDSPKELQTPKRRNVKLQHPWAPDISKASPQSGRKYQAQGYLSGTRLFRWRLRSARLLDARCVVGASPHVAGRQVPKNHVKVCAGDHGQTG